MKKKILFFSLLMGFVLVCVPGLQAKDNPIQKEILDNGLTVLIKDMPQSPMVSVYMLTKAGSATEGEFLGSGISHFLEHMFFKGTERRTSQDIPDAIQSVGGTLNASTGKDFTIFTITVPYEAFDIALDVLADMMMHSKIDAKDFAKERDVILNEMKLHNDQPGSKLYELVSQTIYIRHPYKDPVIGYEGLFKKITRDDIYHYYKKFYVPNNMILSIAGRVERADILPKIKETFKDFERGPTIVRNLPPEPQQISPRRYEEEYPTDLARMSISFPSVSLLDSDLYALDVLANILGQGKSSRLYEDIYKRKQLVYSIGASNYTPVDKGAFSISALFDYPNAAKIIESVKEDIEAIKKEGVKEAELQKAKRQVLSDYVFSNQTSAQSAYLQAIDEAFAGDASFSEKYVSAVKNVTNEQIKDVANRYLNEEAKTIVILKPKGSQEQAIQKDVEAPEQPISKIKLANGLTVLLKEDHTFPLVNVRAILNGGLLQEPEGLNGIAQMTSTLWIKGTKSLSFENIAEITDSKGMSLGSYSGKYSFGITADCLAEDIDTAINLVSDIIQHPSFSEDEIAKVKQDTLAEIKSLDDSIFSFTNRKMNRLLFKEHPLRFDVQGTEESIAAIQREDIVNFYKKLTYPNNMVVSVFGDFDKKAIQKEITQKFGGLEKGDFSLMQFSEPPLGGLTEKEYTLDKEQAMVMYGFHGVEIGDKDQYPLEVISSILGSSLSGRLFDAIREEFGEAYTLGAFSAPGKGAGSIKIYVLTNLGAIDQVKQILTREIQKIRQDPVSEKELSDAKAYLKGSFKASIQTSSSLAFTSSLDELYGLGYDYYQKYDGQIDAVTQEDIQRVANTYLDLNKAVLVVTKPDDLE